MDALSPAAAPPSGLVPADIQGFLVREADLLDRWQLQAWLSLYTEDAVYWLPLSPTQRSGYDTVSHIYDDRRLLETRVRRFSHAMFHAQKPPSRAVRFVSNIRWAPEQPEEGVAVLSSYQVVECRNDRQRIFAGLCLHRLVPGAEGGWRVRLKRLDLVDSESVQDGISIIL